jgi:hypothetical protein
MPEVLAHLPMQKGIVQPAVVLERGIESFALDLIGRVSGDGLPDLELGGGFVGQNVIDHILRGLVANGPVH